MKRVPVGYLSAIWRFFRDKDASLLGKMFVVFTVAYVIMPLDLIPDVAPIIGWLDDLGMVGIALGYLAKATHRYRHPEAAALPEA